MNSPESQETDRLLDVVRKEIENNRLEVALEHAVDGLKKVSKNEARRVTLLSLIGSIVKTLRQTSVERQGPQDTSLESDVKACSFCGRSAEEANILLGAHGAICDRCADRIYQHFYSEAADKD